ncbi:MAG: glyoxylate/hydroxypyruvate reductase A [Pseudomonadota bacterium]
MALIIRVAPTREQWWLEHMQALLPEIECRPWSTPGNVDDIDIAVVWRPPAGGLKRFSNLKAIISIGAGIDHVLADPELPKNVPIIRTTGDDLKVRMREYVTLHVLRLHRCLPEVEAAMERREWWQPVTPPASKRRVGIMGLGDLGGDCARTLATIGFDVAGWSTRKKTIDSVASYAGSDDLSGFLARTDILVCLLPLTPETEGILNADLFNQLPRGASIINVARGGHLIEGDLIDALDRGQIDHATLDVFKTEPLPTSSRFWDHPKVLVTPHVASLIDPVSGGKAIAANVRKFMAGEPVPDMVDLEKGY